MPKSQPQQKYPKTSEMATLSRMSIHPPYAPFIAQIASLVRGESDPLLASANKQIDCPPSPHRHTHKFSTSLKVCVLLDNMVLYVIWGKGEGPMMALLAPEKPFREASTKY